MLVIRATEIVKGRIATPGFVQELEAIRESPSGSTCKSSVSSRLLIWVQGGELISTSESPVCVQYASPYTTAAVTEEGCKDTLR